MSFRYDPEVVDFDWPLWEAYDLADISETLEYRDYVKQIVPGVLNVATSSSGLTIDHIDFESEAYYTMFRLRWL